MDTTALQCRMKRLFTEGFSAMDIAEPLISFDADRPAAHALEFMNKKGLEVVGIREDGAVAGFVFQEDLKEGACSANMRPFEKSLVVAETACFPDVVASLEESRFCFVSILGKAGAIITRTDIQKPPMRMWLFGMITIVEMFISRTLEEKYPDSSWQGEITKERLIKAKKLQKERRRWNQNVRLVDCLQLADKARVLGKDPAMREDMGFESKREIDKMIQSFQSLRNNLAHAQDIISYDWDTIVRISQRLDKIMTRI